MRRLFAPAMLVPALELATAGAVAQGSTQWRTKSVDSRFQAAAALDASREMNSYARCLVNRRYDRARTIVLAPYASPEQAAASSKIVMRSDDSCLNMGLSETRMRFNGEVLAGALGQALVLKDYADLPTVVRSTVIVPEQENARITELNPAEVFGRCVVQRDPDGALALFSSLRGTDEEQRAFKMLLDDFSPCLAAGSTLRISKSFVRNVLGVAAYRFAQQAQPRGTTQAGQVGQAR